MLANHHRIVSTFLAVAFVWGGGCATHLGQHLSGQVQAQGNESSQTAKNPALLDPSLANKKAPDVYKVKVATTKGDFVIKVDRSWAPNGADRFYNLVDIGYFKDIAIFRAIEGFMFQFGIHGDPAVSKQWREANIKDDPGAGVSNRPGFITFANAGPNTRSVQLFINLGDNRRLDNMGFTPFGQVVEGADVVLKINTEYGENPPDVQGSFQARGNEFILRKYPKLDMIKSVTLLDQPEAEKSPESNPASTQEPTATKE